jgi:hypothetical protein
MYLALFLVTSAGEAQGKYQGDIAKPSISNSIEVKKASIFFLFFFSPSPPKLANRWPENVVDMKWDRAVQLQCLLTAQPSPHITNCVDR